MNANRGLIALVLAALSGVLCRAQISSNQHQAATAAELERAAITAYQAKNYSQFLADEKQALALDPDNARTIYNVACGEALAGRAPESVQMLDKLLARKLDLGAETDPDFSQIHETPQWAAFKSGLTKLRKPLIRSRIAFRLEDRDLAATGLVVNPETQTVYIASVRERKIIRRAKNGEVSDFIRPAQDGFLAGDSLIIDAPGRLLYATTSAAPFMRGYRTEDTGESGVFAFDLRSGKTVRKVMLPPDGKRHLLNAMAIDRAGNVYISDTGASGIYLLRSGAKSLEQFVPSNAFRATQGLALSRDEKTLYIADYASGIWALNLATKERRLLEAPPSAWLAGLDGLSRTPDGFVAVQIGVRPQRVLRLRLGTQQNIADVQILEMNHPDYDGPIQGAVFGGAFYYVANSQLELGNGKTGAFDSVKARPTVVLKLPL